MGLLDLLRRCLAGDAAAWPEWVAQVGPVIRRAAAHTLLRHTGSAREEDTDDATQEVFIRLVSAECRRLRSYDPTRSSLGTWLTLVARSTVVDLLRRRRLRTVALDERTAEAVEAPESVEAPRLDIPAGLLSPRQQLVLRLLFEQDLEVREVAGLLAIDEQTVRSTKHKALSALREYFGPARGGRGMASE